MELKDVVAISGKPGLNVIVGKRPTGLIVETLDDSRKRFPTSITQKISILQDISIFTYDSDVPLAEVLQKMDKEVKAGLELVEKKQGGDVIREFFRKILPEFDEDQVYVSDILKIVNWYKILDGHIDFTQVASSDEEE